MLCLCCFLLKVQITVRNSWTDIALFGLGTVVECILLHATVGLGERMHAAVSSLGHVLCTPNLVL